MKTLRPVSSLVSEIKTLAKSGCRFASLLYTAKGSGETALHRVALGVSVENAYKRDLKVLSAKLPTLKGVDAQACEELIASLQESLEKGVGNNSSYTCKGVYEPLARGLKLHTEKSELHVSGFTLGKTVIVPGAEKKAVNSSAKTIAKNKLRKLMKSGNFRQFAFGELHGVKVNGKTISFE